MNNTLQGQQMYIVRCVLNCLQYWHKIKHEKHKIKQGKPKTEAETAEKFADMAANCQVNGKQAVFVLESNTEWFQKTCVRIASKW